MAWKIGGKEQQGQGDWIGFLDKGVKLEGTLELSGTFRIDAEMKGTILARESLVLGENAKVEGKIEANQVLIGGRFDGVITAKSRVEIQAKGVVTGEIFSPCLVIEAGGIFDGQCHMLGAGEGARPVTIPIRAAADT
jgi:cytoskeletal protein CcmA (bactofilin family)